MAYYLIFPEKDTTIYSHPDRDKMNAGHDEILELVKEKATTGENHYASRILMKFRDSEIKDIIENKSGNNYTASLQLFSTEHRNLATDNTIFSYLLSQSWDEGTGRYSNLPTSSNGCSWLYTDNSNTKTVWFSSSFSSSTAGNGGLVSGGGSWYTNFEASQSFSNASDLDTNINVTSLVDVISSSIFSGGTIPNNGFLLKRSSSIEENGSSSYAEIKYFSVDTHTIYAPRLAFKWDDSTFSGHSSATIKNSGELNVSLYRIKKEYNKNEEAKIRVHVRDKYPNRVFVTSSNYLDVGHFTTSSYYSVRDAATEDIIIPFDDNCTKLSADSKGIYFK